MNLTFFKDFLAQAKLHWRTSLFGVLGSSFVAFAATANLDSLSAGQAAAIYAGCLFNAVKSLLQADAAVLAQQATAAQLPPAPPAAQ